MRYLRRLGVALAIAVGVLAVFAITPPGRSLITETLTLKRGADAYLIGYPLVAMEATRAALVQPPATMNTFIHARYLPDGRNRVNVVSPSRDTVYSSVWLDLSDGPMLIEQPSMGDRFWLMPVLDAWTNVVADPGTRTLGNGPHTLVIAGPQWQGPTPPGAQVYRSTTGDLARVARLQDRFRIAPLSQPGDWAQPAVLNRPRNSVDVRAQVDALSADAFFTALGDALADQPLSPDDPEARKALERIGVTPGGFTAPEGEPQRTGLAKVPARVQEAITQAVDSGEAGTISNGWRIPPMSLGAYGTQYAVRAAVAREGLGANLPADAVYASTRVDVDEQPLTGQRRYVIDMPADVPVRGFWSITAYDDQGNLLSGSTQALSVSGDADSGARRIIVSSQRPREPGVAWLRSPTTGGVRLIMRLYWPEQSVLDGEWQFPAVRPE